MADAEAELRQRLHDLARADEGVEGATAEEIAALEAYAGGRLPGVYRHYLSGFGRRAGELFRGTDSGLAQRHRLRLREPADRLVESSRAAFRLPPAAFVFLMTQGYQFAYFPTDAGDDPPVFRYHEGDALPAPLAASLSVYLLRCVEECERRMPASTPA